MSLFRHRIKIKSCSRCGGVHLIEDYYKNRFNEDGLDDYCQWCRLEFNEEWVRINPVRRRLIQWRYRNKRTRLTATA